MKEHTSKIFKDTAVVIAANIINYAGMFVIAVMISRMLGVGALGEFSIVFAISAILSSVNEFGSSTFLVRRINSEPEKVFVYINNTIVFQLLTGSALLIILLIAGTFINNGLSQEILIAGSAIFLPKSLQAAFDASLKVLKKQTHLSVIKSINTFLQISASYILIINSYSLLQILVSIFLMESLTSAFLYFFNRHLWYQKNLSFTDSKFSYSMVKIMLKEGSVILSNNILTVSMQRINLIITGIIISEAAAGIFSAASRIVNSVGLFSGAVYNTYYPALLSLKSETEKQRFTNKIMTYCIFLGFIINIMIFFFADVIIDITFKINDTKIILKLLSFTVVPVIISSVLKAYFYAYHLDKYLFILFTFWWIVNVISVVVCLLYFDINGLAYAVLLTELLFCGILSIKYFSYKNVKS